MYREVATVTWWAVSALCQPRRIKDKLFPLPEELLEGEQASIKPATAKPLAPMETRPLYEAGFIAPLTQAKAAEGCCDGIRTNTLRLRISYNLRGQSSSGSIVTSPNSKYRAISSTNLCRASLSVRSPWIRLLRADRHSTFSGTCRGFACGFLCPR